jgi:hypothetical protein
MEFREALRSTSEVELTVKRSGKWTTRPVWFVVDGATVYVLPRGKKVHAQARPVLDAQEFADVIDRFRSKYGELKRYYRKLDAAIAVTI